MINRKRALLGAFIAFAGCAPARVYAQQQIPVAKEPTRTGGDLPGPIKSTGRVLGKFFAFPLHPIFSTVSSGAGIGGGIAFDPFKGPLDWESKAVYTIRKYWSFESRVEYLGRRKNMELYGRVRDMPRIAFYGVGNNTTEDSRTAFAMRETTIGTWATYRLLPFLTLGTRDDYVIPKVRPGEDPGFESATDHFTGTEVPGLTEQSKYARIQGSAEIDLPANVGNGFYQGTTVLGTYAYYKDLDLHRYTFRRMDVEVQQKFAGLWTTHRLTLHGWVSHTETADGQSVPLYLLRTLGARGQMKSEHENLIGSDGTQATLRGYNTFRFRDRDLLLMQAEYRIPIWRPVDLTLFYDAGKVAPDRADLNLKNLHDDYGFSIGLMRAHSTALRFDIGLGGEGTRYIISIGSGEAK